ncbi:pre-rRNA-processing protein TSR2 homolog isoform X1 [Phymastichus coffea]|uniref:pre-rRNA-processing protein TSR2 homolog isoform X1 n=1 Tax=Phymastichus coffea TaxID=108790 RepID=UPI00273B4814|nr:pre-rRNA-processing protein TSR2 homolog isoform X1 [Phymastichus coffea]
MTENQTTSFSIIQRIFSNWTALRMTVEHGNGSIDAAHSFCEYIDKTLSMNEKLHYTDISEVLEDVLDEDFNTRVEDDSEKEVARDILRFHNYITTNDMVTLTNELQKLPPLQPWIIPKFKFLCTAKLEGNSNGNNENKNNLDGIIGDSEAVKSNSDMEVDSEGWSVIQRRKK